MSPTFRTLCNLSIICCVVQALQIAHSDLYCYYSKVKQQCHKDERFINAVYYTENQERDKYCEDMANNNGLNGLYRPRSALARALYEKQRNDRHLQEYDQNEVREHYILIITLIKP